MKRKALGIALVCALAVLLGAAPGNATPIVYEAQLFDGVAVTGTNTQPPGSQYNPEGANYFYFFAEAGDPLDIFGDRLTGSFDMSFWIIPGLFADTAAFGGSFLAVPPPTWFGDDQDPPNIPGPFGDPHVAFLAPFTGYYTIAVTNFLSSTAGPYDFRLQANGVSAVPEPTSLALLGGGLLALVAGIRRRRAS